MPIINRPTLVDRPVIVDREESNDDDSSDESSDDVQDEVEEIVLGDGGGPEINSIEFEPGDYDVVSGANLAAVLSTGEGQGEEYVVSFVNSAVQLKDLKSDGQDLSLISSFAEVAGVSNLNVSNDQLKILQPLEDDSDGNIEEIEEDIEEVKQVTDEDGEVDDEEATEE
jgi:hypothetical protein